MSQDEIRRDVEEASEAATHDGETLYGYYLTLRGPSLGAAPSEPKIAVAFDWRTFYEVVDEHVYGWVGYARPLTEDELTDYELIPDERNPARYTQYGVEVRTMTRDASGKRQIVSEMVKDAEGAIFATSYRRKAEKLAARLNDEALDTNTKDSISMARIQKLERS